MNNPWQPETPTEMMPPKPEWLTDDLQRVLQAEKLPLTSDGLLMYHQRCKDQLEHWKEVEMEVRKLTVKVLVPDAKEGTNNVELGNGFVAKAVVKYNYKLADNDTVWATLEKIEKVGNQGKFIAERLVSWTPNFLKTEYVTLQEEAEKGSNEAKEILKLVSDMLTITDAAPTLEIREPKAKKK
jgi:DNA-binding TFAR19-related protein (PDSD5 family)